MHASYVGDGNAKTAMLRSDIITWWKWCYSLRYVLFLVQGDCLIKTSILI